MRFRIWVLTLFILVTVSCGGNSPEYKATKLPSGKEIKVTGVGQMNFRNGSSALVMNYLTDIKIEDKAALRKEVDEIWHSFQQDVEKAHLKTGVIRATHVEGGTFIKSGSGYGFVFEKRDDGKWHCLEDDKQKP